MIYALLLVLSLFCALSHQEVCIDEGTFTTASDAAECAELRGTEKWMTFQRRIDANVSFFRLYEEYESGFGEIDGSFWIGLTNLYKLTATPAKLLVAMEGFDGVKKCAKYESFQVAGPEEKYKLTVSGYSGTAGDMMTAHSGMVFTAKDADNDILEKENCAIKFFGGWWYTKCHMCNPNGKYNGEVKEYGVGVNWKSFDKTYETSLKSIRMMISI